MTIGKKLRAALRGPFYPAIRHLHLRPADAVRLAREFNELSQNELAKRCGIPQATISAIENNRVKLGAERAKVLARALKVHPAVLLFPSWDSAKERAA